jgi:hypothetical protein
MIRDLMDLRAAAANGTLAQTARESLLKTYGEGARAAIEASATSAVLERYGKTILALAEAVAAFSVDVPTAEALSAAALAFRDAAAALDARIEQITCAALGIGEH